MEPVVTRLLLVLLVAQVPAALFVHLDARRLGLDRPEVYGLGVLVPAGGVVVLVVYLSRRRTSRASRPVIGRAARGPDPRGVEWCSSGH
jgi:hypothetical protein